jgi:hypothetical protein
VTIQEMKERYLYAGWLAAQEEPALEEDAADSNAKEQHDHDQRKVEPH